MSVSLLNFDIARNEFRSKVYVSTEVAHKALLGFKNADEALAYMVGHSFPINQVPEEDQRLGGGEPYQGPSIFVGIEMGQLWAVQYLVAHGSCIVYHSEDVTEDREDAWINVDIRNKIDQKMDVVWFTPLGYAVYKRQYEIAAYLYYLECLNGPRLKADEYMRKLFRPRVPAYKGFEDRLRKFREYVKAYPYLPTAPTFAANPEHATATVEGDTVYETVVCGEEGCSTSTTYYAGYCLHHHVLRHGTFVTQSTLGARAGLGLFAYHPIKKGAVIGFYWGDIISPREYDDRPIGEYGMVNRGETVVIDARGTQSSSLRYVNFPKDVSKLNARFQFCWEDKYCSLVAIKVIPVNAEIFASYGNGYFHAMQL